MILWLIHEGVIEIPYVNNQREGSEIPMCLFFFQQMRFF